MGEPHVLAVVHVAVDLERQRVGRPLDLDLGNLHLDLAGRQLCILGLLGPHHDLAGHGDYGLEPRALDGRHERARDVDHALGDAVVIAQIDEQQVAVIALAVNPAGKPGV